jgi:hypothetical protein
VEKLAMRMLNNFSVFYVNSSLAMKKHLTPKAAPR